MVWGAAACSAKKYHMLGYCIADTHQLFGAAVLSAQVFNTLSCSSSGGPEIAAVPHANIQNVFMNVL